MSKEGDFVGCDDDMRLSIVGELEFVRNLAAMMMMDKCVSNEKATLVSVI